MSNGFFSNIVFLLKFLANVLTSSPSTRIWEEDEKSDGNGTECFVQIDSNLSVEDYLNDVGSVPIPPYFHRSAEDSDKEAYNNTYAANPGSVAAPTAGK